MQKIDNIEIKNFKSIRHQKIEGCKRINVFVGPPNVGKSNILEALSIFSINSSDDVFSKFIRVESSTGLFFNGNISDKAEIKINDRNRIAISYASDGVKILHEFDRENYGFDTIDQTRFRLDSKDASKLSEFTLRHTDMNTFSFSGSNETNNENSIMPIYRYQFEKHTKFTIGGSYQLSYPFGENIFDVLSSNEVIRKDVIDLFKEYNLKFSFDKSTRQFKILKDVGDDIFLISYSMIADTLQRLIFFKTAIHSNNNSILLFEEPEAHMFPPYISKFASDIIYDQNNNQFFMATHSPFVINDFMENMKKDDYSIYTVGYDKENGETLIRRITDEELHEIYQYGVDLFLNLENYLPHAQQQ
jgi:AAA15 family ATPase/GTPase